MVNDYYSFFEKLAEKHPKIQHQPNETGPNGNPDLVRFARFNEMDLFSSTPIAGHFNNGICLALHYMEGGANPSSEYFDLKAAMTGGIIITKRVELNNQDQEQLAHAECWEVLLDFMAAMMQHTIKDCPRFAQFDERKMKFMQVGPIWDNRFGWYLTFEFDENLNIHKRPNVFV